MITGSQTFTIEQPESSFLQDVPDVELPLEVSGRIRHIFRESLGNGQIHPLYLPILRYRQSQQLQRRLDATGPTSLTQAASVFHESRR